MSALSPVGTIAYIIDEEALLVRVNKGWQYIAVRKIFIFVFSLGSMFFWKSKIFCCLVGIQKGNNL